MRSTKAASAEARLREGGPDGAAYEEARSLAMRELGHALALDPDNVAARASLLRILTEPPAEAPPEVDAAVEASAQEQLRLGARIGGLVTLVWFLFLPIGPLEMGRGASRGSPSTRAWRSGGSGWASRTPLDFPPPLTEDAPSSPQPPAERERTPAGLAADRSPGQQPHANEVSSYEQFYSSPERPPTFRRAVLVRAAAASAPDGAVGSVGAAAAASAAPQRLRRGDGKGAHAERGPSRARRGRELGGAPDP